MVLYTDTITPRLSYILDFFESELPIEDGNKKLTITTDKESYSSLTGTKINYSNQRISDIECWLKPHPLLFEKKIQKQTPECFTVNGNKAFFATEGDWPFDIFAASFYLLSRYEEYHPHEKDEYGRFAFKNSMAYKQQFLRLPLINIWLKDFASLLRSKFESLTDRKKNFTFLPTYDIDEAYSYLHKSWLRRNGGLIKDLLKGKFKALLQRLAVLKGKSSDPFDSYSWMNDLHDKFQLQPYYFFLVAGRTGTYDKNILPREPVMQALIWQHTKRYKIGVHPSWQSGDNPALLRKEKEVVERITKSKIDSSRQHYIRFSTPQTFRNLIESGITKDFSMGYGSINGFRASVASPFYWYDLEKNSKTELMMYPFCFMEANSFYEQKQTAAEALEEMLQYYEVVKAVDGLLITIWHNTFLGTDDLYKGWREAYEKFITHLNS